MVKDWIAMAVMSLVGISIYIGTSTYPRVSNPANDPALFPRAIALSLIFLGVLTGIEARKKGTSKNGDDAPPRELANVKTILLLVVMILVYSLGILRGAFLFLTFAFLAGGALILGERPLSRVLAFSLGLSFGIYGIFVVLLNVPL